MIWVVFYARYDDYELLGASTDHEKAKQIKRDAVKAESDYSYDDISIIEFPDGKLVRA